MSYIVYGEVNVTATNGSRGVFDLMNDDRRVSESIEFEVIEEFRRHDRYL